MYYISKMITISAAHRLFLSYESPCENLHGHNWKINITLESDRLDHNGMLIDFNVIKNKIMDKLDHKTILKEDDPLIDVLKEYKQNIAMLPFNTTAENLALWIANQFNDREDGYKASSIRVEETENNVAIWKKDE